jgi:sigma-B regulation protein RsbU (phosphoserine phosphatase)
MLRLDQRRHDSERHPSRSAVVATRPAPPHSAHPWRQLRDEVERAARVQRSLLPDVSLPVGEFRLASLYRPCETLGGDFYDLARRSDCALLLVADVMGHGVEAALITMLVKAVFQETAESTGEPGELLTQMNARLHRIIPEYAFVAATVVRLELAGPEMRIANAGMPYAFVLVASERRVTEVRLDGRPLGLLECDGQDPYEVRRLSMAPGDVLLIASDGIGSVESARGECFEDRRLRQVLAKLIGHEGRTVVDRLVARAAAFAHGRPLRDDINLVAVSRQAPAG